VRRCQGINYHPIVKKRIQTLSFLDQYLNIGEEMSGDQLSPDREKENTNTVISGSMLEHW